VRDLSRFSLRMRACTKWAVSMIKLLEICYSNLTKNLVKS